jgi:hypothetical protein
MVLKPPQISVVFTLVLAVAMLFIIFVPRAETSTGCSLSHCPIGYHDRFVVEVGDTKEVVVGIRYDNWSSLTSEEFRKVEPAFERTRSYLVSAFPPRDKELKPLKYELARVLEVANGYFETQISPELAQKLGQPIRLTTEPMD